MWFDQGLEVGRGSSIDCLVCQHHHLESDAGYYREPVEVAKNIDLENIEPLPVCQYLTTGNIRRVVRPVVALSAGGTSRPAEVVEQRVRAGVCGLTKAWSEAGAVPPTALYASTIILNLMRAVEVAE